MKTIVQDGEHLFSEDVHGLSLLILKGKEGFILEVYNPIGDMEKEEMVVFDQDIVHLIQGTKKLIESLKLGVPGHSRKDSNQMILGVFKEAWDLNLI